MSKSTSGMHDPYEDQLAAARYRAERDQARQELARLRGEATTMSAYDLLPDEDREAIAWVREHGGMDYVKSEWRSRVPYDRYERRRQRLLGHIAECETALGRRNQRIEELGHRVSDLTTENAELRKRAMPEGCQWPTVDGEPVVIGERMRSCGIDDCKVVGIDPANSRLTLASDNIEEGKATYFPDSAEYCHRPAPKVLDADGAEIRSGEMVYHIETGDEFTVIAVDAESGDVHVRWGYDFEDKTGTIDGSYLTHRAPVLSADGKPLLKYETVYEIKTGERYFVTNVFGGMTEPDFPEHTVECRKYEDVVTHMFRPSQLTHERPDTWQRIEEDSTLSPEVYCHRNGIDISQKDGTEIFLADTVEPMALDLVRRAKKLAERERGE